MCHAPQLERINQQLTQQFEGLQKQIEAFKTKYKIRYTTAAEVSLSMTACPT